METTKIISRAKNTEASIMQRKTITTSQVVKDGEVISVATDTHVETYKAE
jgi:hypothetical protein